MGINFIIVIILLVLGYVLQCFFCILQIKNFTKAYEPLKNKGRVAIGKIKGGFYAGAITMFAIDKYGFILDGSKMVGVTVFAKFKNFDNLNNQNIAFLKEEDLKSFNKPLKKAILNASSNYNIVMSGGEIPTPLSPFEKMSEFFKRDKKEA